MKGYYSLQWGFYYATLEEVELKKVLYLLTIENLKNQMFNILQYKGENLNDEHNKFIKV